MKTYLSLLRRLLLLTLSMTLMIGMAACTRPTTPPVDHTPPNDDGNTTPSPEETGGRYNPHAGRTEGQTSITLREYSVTEGKLLQPEASYDNVPEGLSEVVNQYMTNYDALGVNGTVTTFQTSSRYQNSQRINTEAVMAYVSVPSQLDTVIPSWYAAEDFYSINIMMPINRDSHDYVTQNEYNFEDIQTDKNGNYITHSTSDKVYYMVPTEGWTEYIWDMVKHILETYPIDSITFEEPEMWYASGYSQGFKDAWEDYYNEGWQDQNDSPEAMLKTMRLKVYLFDRLLAEIADRMHELSPDTKLYVASHSTASYTSIAITAGLNAYLATGKIDGVIGQTWSNTASVGLLVDGKNQTLEYENAYLGYASYAGAAGDLDLFAITDAMSDTASWTEDICIPKYKATLVSALMQPEIHRFEASVWPSRGFVAVSPSYRTLQLACFEALNEMSGKAITTSAGTPGITYLLSDSLSWQSGSSAWAQSSKDGYYGVTLPLVSDGIPLCIQSMENIRTADDLKDVTLLILSWDCQKPLSEEVVDAIAAWIKQGGTALYIGGRDAFADSSAEWWAPWGSPLQALFDKLGLDVTIKTADNLSGKATWLGSKNYAAIAGMNLNSKYNGFYNTFEGGNVLPLIKAGDTILGFETDVERGALIAVGFPSAMFSQRTGGADAMQALAAYACNFHLHLDYAPTTLVWTKRGRIVAAHSYADDNVLVGRFIDLFDPTLPMIDYKVLNARDDVLLCDISEADLSIPRLLYSGGAHAHAPIETATETIFTISGPDGTLISSRLACADGLYPQSVEATDKSGKSLTAITTWDQATDSLLIQIQGSVEGATIKVTWGEGEVESTKGFVIEELIIKTNNQNEDAALIWRNTASANANFRYADANNTLIYKIDLKLFRDATISMEILQNYEISYSTDSKSWTILADYSKTEGYTGTLQGGGNNTIVSLDTAILEGATEVYIKIADCNKHDGWGGTIKSLTIAYLRYEDEPPVQLSKPDEDEDEEGNDTSAFEPIGVDYAAKYPDRKKLTLAVNASSEEDKPFIVRDSSAALASQKYTDLSMEIVYRFDLSQYKDAVIVATVAQNYFIQVSKDGKTWTTIQDYAAVNGTRIEGDSNATTVGVSAEKYAAGADYLYIRFANADTGSGWGTALRKLEIFYKE